MNECYNKINSLETVEYIQEIFIPDFVLHICSMAHIIEKTDHKNARHTNPGRC